MKMRYIQILAMNLLLVGSLFAQVPIPVKDQATPIVLKGGTIHTGTGQVIENGVIAFDKGKITYVGNASGFNLSGYTTQDIAGQHVYPGFILPNSAVGLEEVSSVNAMMDANETGQYNQNVRAQIAYNTDSEFPPSFRYNGILLAESTPVGGIISGNSAVMKMEGWNWEDATFKADVAMHFNWNGKNNRNFDFNTFTFTYGPNPNYDKTIQELEDLFQDAVSYSQLSKKVKNIKLESMLGLFDGSKLMVIHAEQAKSVISAVNFAKEMGVKRIAVASGAEMLLIADYLKENNIPVIVPSIHDTPARTDDDYDLPYKLAALLSEKGLTVSISNSGMLAFGRNIPFFAGTSVAHGMAKEDALKLITLNPAKMLGIADRVGSLETGKDATFFVSEGDALDMRTNKLSHAFIDGKDVTLDGRQQYLFKKYADKNVPNGASVGFSKKK